MGNSSSHTHEPLDKGFTRGTYGDVKNSKSASFRFSKRSPKKMDRLRRSFRDSFRRRKDRVPESSKPHQWQSDEQAVRAATCSFPVKYLGCVEVFESRGMQICEEALKVLRNSRRRAIRGLLHVSGDGLRVVDDDTKGLIVDQTIEKVSFCAPDRNHERGFSYICRDGTTRRWMCHGFLANKDSGERLSHAVGCAFAVCLERKQRRDKECGVTMTFDMKNSTFTRSGSFRTQTLTERLAHNERGIDAPTPPSAIVTPQQQKPHNPFAIERPHATPSMLERQGSFRAFNALNSQSPFKRQMSLRINDLPSNAERQKAFLDPSLGGNGVVIAAGGSGLVRTVSPIPEVSPHQIDTVSQLCQELSQGLSLLTQTDIEELNFNPMTNSDDLLRSPATKTISSSTYPTNGTELKILSTSSTLKMSSPSSSSAASSTIAAITAPAIPTACSSSSTINTVISVFPTPQIKNIPSTGLPLLTSTTTTTTNNNNDSVKTVSIPVASKLLASPTLASPTATPTTVLTATHIKTATSTQPMSANASPQKIMLSSPTAHKIALVAADNQLPNADQWLGKIVNNSSPSSSPRRPPSLHSRAKSLNNASDPFDAEWAAGVVKATDAGNGLSNTNPFISPPKPPAQSFQVQL